jgi:DNA-binding NarL/FixJ family response regulator
MAIRAGLRALLSPALELQVVAEAATLAELDPIPPETDVLVLAALFLADGRESLPDLPVLPVHAWGILSLDASTQELAAAIFALREGLLVGSRELIEHLLSRHLVSAEGTTGLLVEALTERESQVLQLLAQGLANKQIAATLEISEHTVKFHVSSIYGKLGVTNRTEAARLGVQLGLVLL